MDGNAGHGFAARLDQMGAEGRDLLRDAVRTAIGRVEVI